MYIYAHQHVEMAIGSSNNKHKYRLANNRGTTMVGQTPDQEVAMQLKGQGDDSCAQGR